MVSNVAKRKPKARPLAKRAKAPSVGQSASINDRVAVFEKRILHFSSQVDVENLLGWLLFASHEFFARMCLWQTLS